MGMPVEPVWEQEDYAFYEDGSETGATLIGSAGAEQTLSVDTVYHCRLLIADTAPGTDNADNPDLTLLWQYNLASGGWLTITGSTPVQFVDNANLVDGDPTTNRDPTGTGTFEAGRIYESANTSAVVISSDSTSKHTEVLLHFQIDSGQVSNGQQCLIRCVEGDGTAFATYVDADIDISAPAAYTLPATVGAYPYTGLAAGLVLDVASVDYSLPATAGAYPYTGGQAGLDYIANYSLPVAEGSYAYTGGQAGLDYVANYTLPATAGAYAYTGLAAGLVLDAGGTDYPLPATAGAYAYTGLAAGLDYVANYSLPATSGSYTYTGGQAGLDYVANYSLPATAGSYAYTGGQAGLDYVANYPLPVVAGAYLYTGEAAGLVLDTAGIDYPLPATSGSYAYTGGQAGLVLDVGGLDYPLPAVSGSYAYTGGQAGLDYVANYSLPVTAGSYAYAGSGITFGVPAEPSQSRSSGGGISRVYGRSFALPVGRVSKKTVKKQVKRAVKQIAVQKSVSFDEKKLTELSNRLAKLISLEHSLAKLSAMAKAAEEIARNKPVPYEDIEVMRDAVEDFIPIAEELIQEEVNEYVFDEESKQNMIVLLVSGL